MFIKLGIGHGNRTLLEIGRVVQELVCINGQNILYFHPLKLGAHLGSLTSRQTFPATWLLLYKKQSVLITAILDFTNWFHSKACSALYPQVPQFAENTLKYRKVLLENFWLDPTLMPTKWTKMHHQAQTRGIELCLAICWYLTYLPHVSFATKWSVQMSNNFRTKKVSILVVEGIKRRSCSQSRREVPCLLFQSKHSRCKLLHYLSLLNI